MHKIWEKTDGVILLTTSKEKCFGLTAYSITITIAPDNDESQELRKKLDFSSDSLQLRDLIFKALSNLFESLSSVPSITESEDNDE